MFCDNGSTGRREEHNPKWHDRGTVRSRVAVVASLVLSESGLPIAYRARVVSAQGRSRTDNRVATTEDRGARAAPLYRLAYLSE